MTHKSVAIASSIAVGVVCCICFAVWAIFAVSVHAEISIDPDVLYKVSDVVDGDTFKVAVGEKQATIRVLGINTPETVDPRRPVQCYGPEASKEAHELLSDRSVKLTFSPQREVKDKYGRYLTYVYRDDGLFYNEFMIKEGYAKEYTVGSAYSLQSEFRTAQKDAQKTNKGLWGACVASSTKTVN